LKYFLIFGITYQPVKEETHPYCVVCGEVLENDGLMQRNCTDVCPERIK
jgi:predicted nucleic acid-binding Zn ribbon protein